ncbi:pyrimidine dimer DNA glycosylase/endonuclease V [Actinomycetaceae bacterium L2_0104]
MRIWSLHPSHLDRMGLVACWRETLLAQAVLAGKTRGYQHHPQLQRFRAAPNPLVTVGAYLSGIAAEAEDRGYNFNTARILQPGSPLVSLPGQVAAANQPSAADDSPAAHQTQVVAQLPVTAGQLDYEWQHLLRKLHERSPQDATELETLSPSPHSLFYVVPGDIEEWERPEKHV